ncbi:MAG: hypothetical protein JSV88_12750 [Candidatus Aminicenantes bacterium]|nr:MAG: hypothetical protein JSV88_12750 [Candidatus Aminicenantes bacterium]
MKNYVIGFLAICIVVLISFMYRDSKNPILRNFPLENKPERITSGEPPLYLYIFFSRNNCPDCLDAIQALNELNPPFVVTGIVPVNELKNEADLRNTTGAVFNLIGFKDSHKPFNPSYKPAIYGVTGSGKILFILPGVPGEKNYLNDFLINFYSKSIELLIPSSDN